MQKRTGQIVDFDLEKIENAIKKAFDSKQVEYDPAIVESVDKLISLTYTNVPVSVETIQDYVERALMQFGYYDIAKTFILYREQRKSTRFVKERIDYMNQYSQSTDNAASSSETDGNANVTMKNVANLEGEVYKTTNRIIQRQRMKDELNILFPEVAKQYETDLDNHIIYTHDEASTPVLKQYCMAVSLYPLLTEGVGNIDGVTPSEPNDLQSFSGQITNLIFLLSSQCKGAVAVGEYFIALNYYVVKEFGDKWYEKLDCEASSPHCLIKRTVRDNILKAFKQFVWGVNQPAGNRSYQSPFTNISYYDHTYFTSLFGEFCYPDGSKPEWIAIDTLQRMFMKWFNQIRLKQVLTFPVETFAMVHNGDDIIDLNYKQLCAEMYAEGHSFFTYMSDNADSLSSCCRLRNEIQDNGFSYTLGAGGVSTGSKSVLTINLNRCIQHAVKSGLLYHFFLEEVVDLVHKVQLAYNENLKHLQSKGMLPLFDAGYINMGRQYLTIGVNGLVEAAQFMGIEINDNPKYEAFVQEILGIVEKYNKKYRTKDILFNCEMIPAENVGVKHAKWDKEAGFQTFRECYNSYFYIVEDESLNVIDKFRMHGHRYIEHLTGGSALHMNLEEHLSKEQYRQLLRVAATEGCNYFTFNIPNTVCNECNHIDKRYLKECPECHSQNVDYLTRVIGYMKRISNFSQARQKEAARRYYAEVH